MAWILPVINKGSDHRCDSISRLMPVIPFKHRGKRNNALQKHTFLLYSESWLLNLTILTILFSSIPLVYISTKNKYSESNLNKGSNGRKICFFQSNEKSSVSSVVLQLEVQCMPTYFVAVQCFHMLSAVPPHFNHHQN